MKTQQRETQLLCLINCVCNIEELLSVARDILITTMMSQQATQTESFQSQLHLESIEKDALSNEDDSIEQIKILGRLCHDSGGTISENDDCDNKVKETESGTANSGKHHSNSQNGEDCHFNTQTNTVLNNSTGLDSTNLCKIVDTDECMICGETDVVALDVSYLNEQDPVTQVNNSADLQQQCCHIVCKQCYDEYILQDPDDNTLNRTVIKCPFCVQ